MESAVLTREESIWLVSDMTTCYNCHIREIGVIMLQSHGVNRDSAVRLMKALGEMETHDKTAFDESKESYRSTQEKNQYRTGQGNVVSVFVYQFGTLVISYLLEEEFRGWNITDEAGNVVGCKLAIRFVDDTDFFVRRKKNVIEVVGKVYKKYINLYQATLVVSSHPLGVARLLRGYLSQYYTIKSNASSHPPPVRLENINTAS